MSLRSTRTCLFAAALLLGACGSGQDPLSNRETAELAPTESPRHVVLITIDTLRADHLSTYGNTRPTSPRIDRMGAEGTLFETVQAPRGLTWPSLTSLITGQYPITHGVRTNGHRPGLDVRLMPQDFADAGYATGAFLSNYGPALEDDPAARGLDRLVTAKGFHERPHIQTDSSLTTDALEWIEAHASEPTFTWLHLIDPHRAYEIPPGFEQHVQERSDWLADLVPLEELERIVAEGQLDLTPAQLEEFVNARYRRGWRIPDYRALFEDQGNAAAFDQLLDLITLQSVDLVERDLRYILERYDAQIASTDQLVGRVLDKLEELGLTEETLVILTSDHGEELYQHNHYFNHGSSIYESVLHVPLILRWPGVMPAERRVGEVVELIDVLPTVLLLCGIEPAGSVEGEDLATRIRGERTEAGLAFSEVYPHYGPNTLLPPPPLDAAYSVRDAHWRLVANPAGLQPRSAPYPAMDDRFFAIDFEELYDRDRDPGEHVNLLAFDGDVPRALSGKQEDSALSRAAYLGEVLRARERLHLELVTWLKTHQNETEARMAEIPPDVAERMAALGYVDVAPSTLERDGAESAIAHEALLRSMEALAREALDGDSEDPALAALLLGEALVALGDSEGAREALTRFQEQDGDERAELAERAKALVRSL